MDVCGRDQISKTTDVVAETVYVHFFYKYLLDIDMVLFSKVAGVVVITETSLSVWVLDFFPKMSTQTGTLWI